MTDPRIINLLNEPLGDAVYVGRGNPRKGLRGSPFANPFRLGPDGSRAEVLGKYRQHLRDHPELVEQIRSELAGAEALACWCWPLACHASVIASGLRGEEP